MALKRAREPSASIETLNLYSLIRDVAASMDELRDPQGRARFMREVEAALDQSVANERRLHGRWAQDLFRAMLISLDGITMIKDEDGGEFYIEQDAPLALPDFRVVTRSGEHLLIEVKNVGQRGRPRPQKLRAATVQAQLRYAKLTGARLLYAHYWATTNHWSLIDPQALRPQGNHLILEQGTAMIANELGSLGDRVIVTDSTLTLSLSSAEISAVPVDGPDPLFADLPLPFELGGTKFLCNGMPIVRPDERRVGAFLLWYGGGAATLALEVDEDDRPVRLNITWSSPAGSKSPTVGSFLSSMFTNRYIMQTKQADGTVALMRHHPDPELTRLLPADYTQLTGWVTPLWVGHQFPSHNRQLTGAGDLLASENGKRVAEGEGEPSAG
jgi:hypothetical protein